MEPRSFKRGNMGDAESIRVPSTRASMEPRSFKRGNTAKVRHTWKTSGIASMEPRSFKRGNCTCEVVPRLTTLWLQWSHAHSSVETVHEFDGASVIGTIWLQWSHAHSSVETVAKWRAALDSRQGQWLQWSHAHSSVETRHDGESDLCNQRSASMEPRSFKRGNACGTDEDWIGSPRSFNGATLIQAWKRP